MYNENLKNDKMICLSEEDDLVHRNDAIEKEKVKHLPRYITLKFRPFTKSGWYFAYLENDFYQDKIRVDVEGRVYRHPYDKYRKCYIMDQWTIVQPQQAKQYVYDGYDQFTWHGHTLQIHRLVAMAWCEKSGYDPDGYEWEENEKLEVDHIDKNIHNNHPSNLRWVSKKWNANGKVDRPALTEGTRESEYQYLMGLNTISDDEYCEMLRKEENNEEN